MTIETKLSDDEKSKTLCISGRFDFSIQSDFRGCYKNDEQTGIKYIVDLSKTDYIDSSALGMLLLLKEHAESHKDVVMLSNPSAAIMKILTMANFEKIFSIS